MRLEKARKLEDERKQIFLGMHQEIRKEARRREFEEDRRRPQEEGEARQRAEEEDQQRWLKRAEEERLKKAEELRRRQEEEQRRAKEEVRQAELRRIAEEKRRVAAEGNRKRQAEEKEEEEALRRMMEEEEEEAQRRHEAEEAARHEKLCSFLEENGFRAPDEKRVKGGVFSSGFCYPLHVAVEAKDVEAVQALLWAGADPSLANSKKKTPLQLAKAKNKSASSDYSKVIEALLGNYSD